MSIIRLQNQLLRGIFSQNLYYIAQKIFELFLLIRPLCIVIFFVIKNIVTVNSKDSEQKALQKVEVYKWILVYENVSKYNFEIIGPHCTVLQFSTPST